MDNNDTENKPTCPFQASMVPAGDIMQNIVGRVFKDNENSAALLKEIGGGDRVRAACSRFYSYAFQDKLLDQFMFGGDGAEMHGKRLGDWIVEKMGGEGKPWTDSGRDGMRQPTHFKAWNNPKRADDVRGDHFKLADVFRWMCLHFRACRETGLDQHESFFKFYVGFMAHFSRIYDRDAPLYA